MRLDSLKAQVMQAISDSNREHITQEEAENIIREINEEVSTIMECGKLLNSLKKGD